MNTTKFEQVYPKVTKENGQPLDASEWNEVSEAAHDAQTKINSLIDDVNEAGVTVVADPDDDSKSHILIGDKEFLELTVKSKGINVSVVGNNNINIEPREALGTGEAKSGDNMKGGNIALKPGDDIEFWAHHRGSSKSDEVSVKMLTEVPKASDPTKTDEVAAKLQLNTADIVLTSKDKQEESDVMNIIVNKAAGTRGYLKVRAQAIDLRCETDGGIALQPNGNDGSGHENKIKFEHNGGDGVEFGTFNSQKTSIFTDEYRFNKAGVIYAATRGALETTYKEAGNPESGVKKIDYPTQADDFKDILDSTKSCTWNDIIVAVNYLKSQQPSLDWTPVSQGA